jgi:hypothetical protein
MYVLYRAKYLICALICVPNVVLYMCAYMCPKCGTLYVCLYVSQMWYLICALICVPNVCVLYRAKYLICALICALICVLMCVCVVPSERPFLCRLTNPKCVVCVVCVVCCLLSVCVCVCVCMCVCVCCVLCVVCVCRPCQHTGRTYIHSTIYLPYSTIYLPNIFTLLGPVNTVGVLLFSQVMM